VPTFRKAALIYNPIAGTRSSRRRAQVDAAAAVFRTAGVEVQIEPTRAAGSASQQAMEAAEAGCDAIIGCGGDGTIHELIQEVVATRARVSLGVIPLGTGNGLAADLGIPRRPEAAARILLASEACRIAVGKIESTLPGGVTQSRYFIITAGVGADAEMLYQISLGFKQRHGLAAYYAHAVRLIASHRFVPFEVEFRTAGDPGQPRREVVSQALGVRIATFGGLVRKLAPGASLRSDAMRLLLFKSPRRMAFIRHVLGSALGRSLGNIPDVELVFADEAVCTAITEGTQLPAGWHDAPVSSRIYAQADGELVGGLPVRLSMVRDALTLLMPASK
jgi:YegS/Rv2252/BmrU family lipid kinase